MPSFNNHHTPLHDNDIMVDRVLVGDKLKAVAGCHNHVLIVEVVAIVITSNTERMFVFVPVDMPSEIAFAIHDNEDYVTLV